MKLVVDQGGCLSKAKRPLFEALSDEQVARLEAVVRARMLET